MLFPPTSNMKVKSLKMISIWSTLYTLIWDKPHASAGRDPFGPYYWYGCLYAQPRKYKWLQICNSGGSLLCGVVVAMWTYTCWCVIWSFNILRLLNFVMEVRANNTWITCSTCELLLLINSLMMAPWCQNMWECVLCSVLFYFN